MTFLCEGCYAGSKTREECVVHMRSCRITRDVIVEEKLALQERASAQAEPSVILASRYRHSRTEAEHGFRVGIQATSRVGTIFEDP